MHNHSVRILSFYVDVRLFMFIIARFYMFVHLIITLYVKIAEIKARHRRGYGDYFRVTVTSMVLQWNTEISAFLHRFIYATRKHSWMVTYTNSTQKKACRLVDDTLKAMYHVLIKIINIFIQSITSYIEINWK